MSDLVVTGSTESMAEMGRALRGFLLEYKCGIEEIVTKLTNLREEFTHLHDYNPIESISSRLKTPESLAEKVARKGSDGSFESVRATITDIAGVRVTCSFVSDVYRVFRLLADQADVRVVEVRDYIAEPKANGYRSLHALVEVPVFLSHGPVPVLVEVQLRTIAMDFWASLEHKIYYKYRDQVPDRLLAGLKAAADDACALDATMEELHHEVKRLGESPGEPHEAAVDRIGHEETFREALRHLQAPAPGVRTDRR